MAEENDLSAPEESPQPPQSIARRSRTRGISLRRSKAKAPAQRTAPAVSRPRRKAGPVRSLVILTMVGGLIATVALPAYGAWRTPAEASVTLQQVAADDAQSLVVASDTTSAALSRGS